MDIKRQMKPAQTVAQPNVAETRRRRPQLGMSKVKLISALVVLLLIFSAFITYKYVQVNRQIKQLRNNPQQVVSTSTQKLLAQVGQLAELPSGTPTVAIVKNVSKLSNQPFFTDAQNGDYVIVYTQAKRAVLYRPSTNKIVEYENTN